MALSLDHPEWLSSTSNGPPSVSHSSAVRDLDLRPRRRVSVCIAINSIRFESLHRGSGRLKLSELTEVSIRPKIKFINPSTDSSVEWTLPSRRGL